MTTPLDRIRGCLLGGAIGDALGAGIEFDGLAAITRKHGQRGIEDFVPCYGRDLAITDDTQMTLFTAEGLLDAARDGTNTVGAVWAAYLRWLDTQSGGPPPEGSRGLATLAELRHRRSPGNTCTSALRNGQMGTTSRQINDSKGCGGVMRVAPVGFAVATAHEAWTLGCDTAALTHSHRCGWTSAGALAVMIWELNHGADLISAIDAGHRASLRDHAGTETANWIARAVQLANGTVDGETIDRFGAGWVGEEALAIAVACVLAHDDPNTAILAAVNHSGDSDSTGSIAGQLLGTAHGPDPFRPEWVRRVELSTIIELAASDLDRIRTGLEATDRTLGSDR